MDELLLSPDKAWKLNLVLQRLYLMGAPKVLMACIILLTANSKLDTFTEGRIENIIAQKIPEFITSCDMRTTLLILAVVAMGGSWMLEQPRSSLLTWHPRIRLLWRLLPKVYQAKWWAGMYGAPTWKRHIGWSSSPTIQCLDLGRLCKKYKDTIAKYGVKSTKQYKSKTGVKRFAGSKALKSTGSYPPKFGLRLARLYPRFIRTRPRFWAHVEENNLNFGIDLFESLPWHDVDWWVDARMESVFRYLRGSHDLKLGGLRSLFPTEI
ncbi:unnamed protein product [Durusdinium trenchii]|uniref:Uncharacterized protein n=1 Tax=Durusdinium trenchii TaxID=1381693 RepID=A0ABP0H8I0_9DINO